MKKLLTLLLVCTLAVSAASTFVGCKKKHTCSFGEWIVDSQPTCFVDGSKHRDCVVEGCDKGEDGKVAVEVEAIPASHTMVNGVCSVCGYDPANTYTYRTYTTTSPSNWNELTYLDNNDTQIMGYIGGAFFESDFKYDAEGNIVPGEFEAEYSFATALEDLSGEYGYEEGSGYVWKITIRDDGKWDNGDSIVAGDFVYSMKEQLNPLFLNRRADSFYKGSVNIVGAKEYLFQGQEGTFAAADIMTLAQYDAAQHDSSLIFSLAAPSENNKVYGASIESALRTMMGFPASYTRAACASYLKTYYISTLDLEVVASMEGKTLAEIKADPTMNAEWSKLIGWWQTEPGEEIHFCVMEGKFPEKSFDEVGIWAESDTELVVHLLDPIQCLDADGNLTYHVFYEFASLPLVHRATYEANKVAPTTEGGLWTTTYNTSVASTRSWGPYKLTYFQAGKYYVLERNNNWYGYNMEKYDGLYQTDRIECETITSYETAFMKFLAGEITGIGIDVSKAADYRNSKRAYYTPDDFVQSMQLQSDKEALENRETAGVNKTLLTYADFRKALSLSFNRDAYTQTCTTSSLPGFGIFNSMHYYDVANGGVYRNEDIAKQVLCDVYGVDVSGYEDLDEAYAAITGYDKAQAKELLDKAYNEALEDGEISATDKVILTVGAAEDTESTQRLYNFIKNSVEELAKGTLLEGRLTCEFDPSYGDAWADDFKAGAYDICTGGWTGAAWDPGYFLMAYLSPDYMYSQGWDTSAHNVEMTVHGVKIEDGAFDITNNAEDSFTAVLPVYGENSNDNWYGLLNGAFRDGVLDNKFRLEMIAAIEKVILSEYYTVPIAYSFGASLISYQVEYITYEYNTFNGYGGIQYMTYKYNDAQWAEYCANNELNYKG